MLSFSGIWNIPGIFQKNTTTSKIFYFLEYGIFRNIPKKSYHNQKCHYNMPFLSFNNLISYILWKMEYSKILQQGIFSIFWNMEYSKNGNKKNIKKSGIWNIQGIFLKNSKTIKIPIILEYGIFHWIFLEYSINCKTSLGGVKFNQAF